MMLPVVCSLSVADDRTGADFTETVFYALFSGSRSDFLVCYLVGKANRNKEESY